MSIIPHEVRREKTERTCLFPIDTLYVGRYIIPTEYR